MGKQLFFALACIASLGSAQPARASNIAPRGRPRCSMSTPAITKRLMENLAMDADILADVAHLLPHIEASYTPIGVHENRREENYGPFRQTVLGLKPSFATCAIEIHAVGEVGLGGMHTVDEKGLYGLSRQTEWIFDWRIGGELLLRPSRLLGEQLRIFDALAIGGGVVAGGNIITPIYGSHGHGLLMEMEDVLELGPRGTLDLLEWMSFTAALNVRTSIVEFHDAKYIEIHEPRFTGISLSFGLQFSFPGHAIFAHAQHN